MSETIEHEWSKEHLDLFFKFCINEHQRDYQETGDVRHLLRLFRLCYEYKEPQLPEVLDWLAKALIQFEDNNGTGDLNKLLGLNAPGKGKLNSIASAALKARQNHHLELMNLLICLFDVSIAAAAEGVWLRETVADRPVSNTDWLDQQYRRYWKKKVAKENLSPMDIYPWRDRPEKVKEFLESFPEDWRRRHVLK